MAETMIQKEQYNKVIDCDDSRTTNMNKLMGLFKEKEIIEEQIDGTFRDLLNCQNDLETLIDKTVQEWVSDNPYMELYPIYDGKHIDKVYLSRDKRDTVLSQMKRDRSNIKTRKQIRITRETSEVVGCNGVTGVIQTDSVKIQDVDNKLLYNMVCDAWNILHVIEENHALQTKIYHNLNYQDYHNYD